jgi:hypothetical protein
VHGHEEAAASSRRCVPDMMDMIDKTQKA